MKKALQVLMLRAAWIISEKSVGLSLNGLVMCSLMSIMAWWKMVQTMR